MAKAAMNSRWFKILQNDWVRLTFKVARRRCACIESCLFVIVYIYHLADALDYTLKIKCIVLGTSTYLSFLVVVNEEQSTSY